jgi:hypothetical protein
MDGVRQVATATITYAKIELLETVFSVRSAVGSTSLYKITAAREYVLSATVFLEDINTEPLSSSLG